MKNILILSVAIALSSCSPNQTGISSEQENELPENTFNQELADKYGADEYGMKMYVMAFLKSGPNRDYSDEEGKELQKAHMDNMDVLIKENKLVLAGPFGGDSEFRGIYIFNTNSIDEARAWTETDPAIKAGSLEMELLPWYGSAAVMAIKDLHGQIAKKDI